MWRYFIQLFTERNYGDFVESAEDEQDGLPLCSNPTTAIDFSSTEELHNWVKHNTSLDCTKGEYGVKGIFYPDYLVNGKHLKRCEIGEEGKNLPERKGNYGIAYEDINNRRLPGSHPEIFIFSMKDTLEKVKQEYNRLAIIGYTNIIIFQFDQEIFEGLNGNYKWNPEWDWHWVWERKIDLVEIQKIKELNEVL